MGSDRCMVAIRSAGVDLLERNQRAQWTALGAFAGADQIEGFADSPGPSWWFGVWT